MKLSSIETDPAIMEQGEWVKDIPEMEDLELRVRPLGNDDYRNLHGKLTRAVPRDKRDRGGIVQDEQDRIQAKLLAETVLLDWKNLDVAYSKEKAIELMTDPRFRKFYSAVMYAASVVEEGRKADTDAAAKN